jgi:hypothetical protein
MDLAEAFEMSAKHKLTPGKYESPRTSARH